MKFFRFDRAAGADISEYSTKNVILTRIAKISDEVEVGVMHFGPRGGVAHHQVAVPQLFMLVQGGCFVRVEGANRRAIAAGQAVFWGAGEWQEIGSDYGALALVVESAALDPA